MRMKQKENSNRYEPPRLEAVQVRIEHGYEVSLAVDAEDWLDGGGGNLSTE